MPDRDLVHEPLGDRTDELGRHFGAVLFGQERLNLAHGHTAGIHGNDLLIEPGERRSR